MRGPDVVRAKVAAKFGASLGDADVGKRLEIVLWNAVLRSCQKDGIPFEWTSAVANSFRERYTSRAVGIDVFNLRRNERLRASLLDGSIPLKRFVVMKPWEMDPDKWAPVFEQVAFKQLRKQLTTDIDTVPEGMLTCRKCKSKKTTFMEIQTRSADEPMTVFATCLACQHRWKQ